jgi:hypothetical protein
MKKLLTDRFDQEGANMLLVFNQCAFASLLTKNGEWRGIAICQFILFAKRTYR